MKMTKSKRIIVSAIGLLALGSLANFVWAGDVKGKVTAAGMPSPENIVVYIDRVPGKTFLPPV